MRTRTEIEREVNHYCQPSRSPVFDQAKQAAEMRIVTELLLDMRDLLDRVAYPPMHIHGEAMAEKIEIPKDVMGDGDF